MARSIRSYGVVAVALLIMAAACAKPIVRATDSKLPAHEQTFAAGPNAIYYAIRWALAERGYPVGMENLHDGVLTTAWTPTKSDSHYLAPFGRPDYGAAGAYYQLEVRVIPEGGQTRVAVESRVRSVARGHRSSGREEVAVLKEIAHYLRGQDVQISNVGAEE